MTTKIAHTPTPYRIDDDSGPEGGYIVGYVERVSGNCHVIKAGPAEMNQSTDELNATSLANAEFIVRACNSHDGFLSACEAVTSKLEHGEAMNGYHDIEWCINTLKAEIAKARGEA